MTEKMKIALLGLGGAAVTTAAIAVPVAVASKSPEKKEEIKLLSDLDLTANPVYLLGDKTDEFTFDVTQAGVTPKAVQLPTPTQGDTVTIDTASYGTVEGVSWSPSIPSTVYFKDGSSSAPLANGDELTTTVTEAVGYAAEIKPSVNGAPLSSLVGGTAFDSNNVSFAITTTGVAGVTPTEDDYKASDEYEKNRDALITAGTVNDEAEYLASTEYETERDAYISANTVQQVNNVYTASYMGVATTHTVSQPVADAAPTTATESEVGYNAGSAEVLPQAIANTDFEDGNTFDSGNTIEIDGVTHTADEAVNWDASRPAAPYYTSAADSTAYVTNIADAAGYVAAAIQTMDELKAFAAAHDNKIVIDGVTYTHTA